MYPTATFAASDLLPILHGLLLACPKPLTTTQNLSEYVTHVVDLLETNPWICLRNQEK